MACRGKALPLFISFHILCNYPNQGLQIYWSRNTKYPSEKDCEGQFFQDKSIQDESFIISNFGEKNFSVDFVYLGVYSMTPDMEVDVAYSFKVDNCKNFIKSDKI